jgi:CBS domain-containing protein
MLHRNAAQAREDGQIVVGIARQFDRPPTELGADPKHIFTCSFTCRDNGPGRDAREVPMTVSIILAAKGRDTVTIEPNASLAEAVHVLAEKRIGAALILGADRRIAGIISERDIVRALAERGAAVLDEPVSRTMTRKVETCSENEPVANIMERMTAGKFRHMPVVAQGRLVGIVSIGDIVKHRVQEMERESVAMRDYILTA